jgi:hypothetical protein
LENFDKLSTFADENDQMIDINEERFIANRCDDADIICVCTEILDIAGLY